MAKASETVIVHPLGKATITVMASKRGTYDVLYHSEFDNQAGMVNCEDEETAEFLEGLLTDWYVDNFDMDTPLEKHVDEEDPKHPDLSIVCTHHLIGELLARADEDDQIHVAEMADGMTH